MSQLTAVFDAIAYIEAHLRAPVTVGDVADAVGYSLFHFSRTFNRIVQHTPYDYLMRRRVSAAAAAVLESDRLMIDIAYDTQFANPETFTRAFRRMFSITPSDARLSGCLPYRQPMPPLTMADLAYRSGSSAGKPTTVCEPGRVLVGVQTRVDGACADAASAASAGSVPVDALWRVLSAGLAAQGLKPDHTYAVVWRDAGGGASSPLVAVGATLAGQSADSNHVAAPLVTLRLGARQAARCPHTGSVADLALCERYLIHTWLPKAKLWQADGVVVLDYGARPGGQGAAPEAISVGVSEVPGHGG
jgi:AraC-like DNA-binding protein